MEYREMVWSFSSLTKPAFSFKEIARLNEHRNNCEGWQSQVTWKVKFKCPFCLSCLSCLSRLSRQFRLSWLSLLFCLSCLSCVSRQSRLDFVFIFSVLIRSDYIVTMKPCSCLCRNIVIGDTHKNVDSAFHAKKKNKNVDRCLISSQRLH